MTTRWVSPDGWRVTAISLDGRQLYRLEQSPALAARLGVPVNDTHNGRRLGPIVGANGYFWKADVTTIEAIERFVPLADLEEVQL